MSRVLCVFAHREDHIVAGWPWMQDDRNERFVLRCTDDMEDAVRASCAISGATYLGNMGLPNGFAVQPARYNLNQFYGVISQCVSSAIVRIQPDLICTHNPWGEYGHYDHRFLFSVVYNEFRRRPIAVTNQFAISSYYQELRGIPREHEGIFNAAISEVYRVHPNLDFYKEQADSFRATGAWTENENLNPPLYPKTCTVAVIPGDAQ